MITQNNRNLYGQPCVEEKEQKSSSRAAMVLTKLSLIKSKLTLEYQRRTYLSFVVKFEYKKSGVDFTFRDFSTKPRFELVVGCRKYLLQKITQKHRKSLAMAEGAICGFSDRGKGERLSRRILPSLL